MRELSISDLEIVSGGITETTCVAGFSLAGWVAGAVLTKTATGASNVAAFTTIVGGLVCGEITGDSDG